MVFILFFTCINLMYFTVIMIIKPIMVVCVILLVVIVSALPLFINTPVEM